MKLKTLGWIVLAFAASAIPSAGQSSAPPASSNNSSAPAANGSQPASGGLGFSIETEMLTYKSIEADSEVLACEIARYLGAAAAASPNVPCSSTPAGDNRTGVVIVSPSSAILADFQLWRADMAAMNTLELRAEKPCGAQPATTTAPSTMGAPLLGATPIGQAIPLIQGILGAFATNQSISPVTGTVHDQALMDEVARQLRALNVSVLVPETYSPFALGGTDYANSPFLASFTRLINTRAACLQAEKDASAQQKNEIDSIIAGIDQFMELVTSSAPPSSAGQANKTEDKNPPAPSPVPAENQPSAEPPSHITSLLAADGLARGIGVKPDGTMPSGSPWQHILWLKALESGGSVTKEGNIFGSKASFSGGAVVTYALFNLDGNLDCSGNVYDYAGFIPAKRFREAFLKMETDPTKQLPVSPGSCSSPKPSN
ncbi:MAG: hypothetical protein ACLQMT_05145 [Candidatus Acidiferrales bacterium]